MNKNEELVNNINDALTDFKNTIIKKEFPENENPSKIIDVVEKILDFNKQQKRYNTQNTNSQMNVSKD